jgi:hypothetical protein
MHPRPRSFAAPANALIHSATGRTLGGVSDVQAPLSGGQSCTPGWRSQLRVRLASGLWADELVRRLRVGQGKPCMAVGRRACPSRQLRRRSTSWSSSVSDCMSSTQAPSRLKQIDGRSCTGNANLLKLGGRPARLLRGFATACNGSPTPASPSRFGLRQTPGRCRWRFNLGNFPRCSLYPLSIPNGRSGRPWVRAPPLPRRSRRRSASGCGGLMRGQLPAELDEESGANPELPDSPPFG